MTLKHLTDQCLLRETAQLVQQEREILANILHHFREIERRRLYDGCTSLFEYATRRCGYSEDQAYRRIAAMRLLKELPELQVEIEAGVINLSHVGMAHTLFKSEKKNGNEFAATEKMKIFRSIAGKSAREAQKTIATFASQPIEFRETIKAEGKERNIAQLEISDETLAKVDKLKGLLAHQHPGLSIGQLLDQLCDLGLEQWSPGREPDREVRSGTRAEVRREIWKRDGGSCQRCRSKYAIQEDHLVPRSMGGEYTVENMRLFCRSCNQRAAIEKLGLDKMDAYLN